MTWIEMARRTNWVRYLGIAGLIGAILGLTIGSVEVDRQAIAPSTSKQVANVLLKIDGIAQRQILASGVRATGLPVSGDADRDDTERNEELARKYGLTLPARYRPFPPNSGRYYIRPLPWAIGGLEIYEEKEVRQIKPFAWPIQQQEWQLDYWLDKGFTVFVVSHEDAMLRSNVNAYRRLHEQIRERGKLIAKIHSDRTLFDAGDTSVYLFDPGKK